MQKIKDLWSNLKNRLPYIPQNYRKWTSYFLFVLLIVAMPIAVWGLTSGRFELRERAASFEPTPTPVPALPFTMQISTSERPLSSWGPKGIITVSYLNNFNQYWLKKFLINISYDSRIIDFTINDIDPILSGGFITSKEITKVGQRKYLKLTYEPSDNGIARSIFNINYTAKKVGRTDLVFEQGNQVFVTTMDQPNQPAFTIWDVRYQNGSVNIVPNPVTPTPKGPKPRP